MNILTLKQAFDDTFDNARFCESILDTEPQLKNGKGVAMSLYIGAFIMFIGKVKTIKPNEFEEIRDWFIDETLKLISGNPDIEPELSVYQYDNIELLRKVTNLYGIPNIIVK